MPKWQDPGTPMPDLSTTAQPLFAALARRAELEGHYPWLFYRPALDWEWRSWGQVADQVARGAVIAGEAGTPRLAFDGRLDPDDLAAVLAILAAGKIAVPSTEPRTEDVPLVKATDGGEDGSVTTPETADRLILPACRDHLDRAPLEVLGPPAAPGSLALPSAPRPLSLDDLDAESSRFAGLLPDGPPRKSPRPILCATPALDAARLLTLLAWTVDRGAAWVLEPSPEAFQAAALWARPTTLVATGDELDSLAGELSTPAHRRHHRLQTVVATGEPPADPGVWERLGVPVRSWLRL